jgi:chromosome partitioning protein
MKAIVVANQKGGSGKSTITVHLAAAAERAGDGPVVISDTEPRYGSRLVQSAQEIRHRHAALFPPYPVGPQPTGSGAWPSWRRLSLHRYGASIGAVNADLFALADLILVPLNPTPADLRALVKGLPLVRRSGKPFQFILTRVRPNLRNNDGAAVALMRWAWCWRPGCMSGSSTPRPSPTAKPLLRPNREARPPSKCVPYGMR